MSDAATPENGLLELMCRLRDRLGEHGFTHDRVIERLGPVGADGLRRNETVPGEMALSGADDPLAILIRLWVLQLPVSTALAEHALPGLTGALTAAGLLSLGDDHTRAGLTVRPYATEAQDLWVVADPTPGLDGAPHGLCPDHVIGLSPAASSLAQMTVRRPVGRALDLGTGCGVQALHLAAHADHVVATDVNPRALWLTRLNAALNRVSVEVREGSLYEPLAGERYDLLVSNPPFVVSPATGTRLVYRDSGLPGDQMTRTVVEGAVPHLADGGVAQVLGNWAVVTGEPWEERVAAWCAGADAWVVERERLDPAAYAEIWLKDAGLHPTAGGDPDRYRRTLAHWLAWFAAERIEAVGMGWLQLRQSATGDGDLRVEQWPYAIEQPLAQEVAAHLDRVTWLREHGDRLLDARLRMREDVEQETRGVPGAADPATIVLRQQRGMRRARRVDTVEAALGGACDGDLTAGQVLAAVGKILGRDGLPADYRERVRDLVAEGYLVAE